MRETELSLKQRQLPPYSEDQLLFSALVLLDLFLYLMLVIIPFINAHRFPVLYTVSSHLLHCFHGPFYIHCSLSSLRFYPWLLCIFNHQLYAKDFLVIEAFPCSEDANSQGDLPNRCCYLDFQGIALIQYISKEIQVTCTKTVSILFSCRKK